jgi:hypothetical protein
MFTLGARTVPVLLAVILVLLGALLLLSVKAFASSMPGPTFTTAPAVAVTEARFAIPDGGSATWTLRVWSHGQLIGSSRGTSGVLTVPVPATQACNFQADIRTTRPGGRFRYVTGKRILGACCPPGPASSGLTTSASPS